MSNWDFSNNWLTNQRFQTEPRNNFANVNEVSAKITWLWPVYVGNFVCVDRYDDFRNVSAYFAFKGVIPRCAFRVKGQIINGIYDMLVYFASEDEAKFAIERCHRDSYGGYTLNVFPGRIPLHFDPARSFMFGTKTEFNVYGLQSFENYVASLNLPSKITSSVKFDSEWGGVEFATHEQMKLVMKVLKQFEVKPPFRVLQMQRFLEKDLLDEIEHYLGSIPNALRIDPRNQFITAVLEVEQLTPPVRTAQPHRRNKEREYRREQHRIFKRLKTGRPPVCHYRNTKDVDHFYWMVRQAKRVLAKQNLLP